MNWRNLPIKEYFLKALTARRLSDESCAGAEYCDESDNLFILMRDYRDTLNFLSAADEREIACAVDVLEDLANALPKDKAQAIIDVFKSKLQEFPDVQKYSASDYLTELSVAQDIVDNKN